MTSSTTEAPNFVPQLDLPGAVTGSPSRQNHKAATTLLCEVKQQRDFWRPIARRATKVFRQVSRHRITQVLPVIRSASRATRSVLFAPCARDYVLRDASTAKKMIKLAFLDVNICLIVLVISMNVLVLHPCLPDSGGTQAFGHDTISFLHDLITQTLCRCLQYGIDVLEYA